MIEQRFTNIEGHELAFLAANEHVAGPCIVLLHGILGSPRFWPPTLPTDVRRSVRWYSFGLPGHSPDGRSVPANLRAEELARTMLLAIEGQTGDAPVSLVGWSTGGFLALSLAAQFPERIARVLSICGFARGRWRGLLGRLQELTRGGTLGSLAFRHVVRLMQATNTGYSYAHWLAAADRQAFQNSQVAKHVLAAIYPDFKRHSPAALFRIIKCIAESDISPELGAIRCPTTIVGGTHDSIIRFEHTRQLAQAIPHSQFVAWGGCGHMFFAERTALFHDVLRKWLADRHVGCQLTAVA